MTYSSQKGFSLVETLVAVMVISLSTAGPLVMASKSLNSANYSKDQITAFYLAQEATEMIRNKRDVNAIRGNVWTTGLSNCIGQTCTIDATLDIDAGNLTAICGGTCPVLRQNSASGLFGYNGAWPASRFRRDVRIDTVNASEISATITITWTSGTFTRTFTIKENFLDWQ